GAHDARAPALLETHHPLAHAHRHALLPIVVHEERRQVGGEYPGADSPLRNEHRDVAALYPQRRGDLAPDTAAADHRAAQLLAREPAQPAVILDRAEIDDRVRLERQAAGRAAGREPELR